MNLSGGKWPSAISESRSKHTNTCMLGQRWQHYVAPTEETTQAEGGMLEPFIWMEEWRMKGWCSFRREDVWDLPECEMTQWSKGKDRGTAWKVSLSLRDSMTELCYYCNCCKRKTSIIRMQLEPQNSIYVFFFCLTFLYETIKQYYMSMNAVTSAWLQIKNQE